MNENLYIAHKKACVFTAPRVDLVVDGFYIALYYLQTVCVYQSFSSRTNVQVNTLFAVDGF